MKKTINFTYEGVKYTGIETAETNPNRLYVGVSQSAKMIRQYLAQKYPQFTGRGILWVSSRKFANGNAIDVLFNRLPEENFLKIKKDLQFFGYYDGHNYKGGQLTSDEGYVIDFGTKYLGVYNAPPSDSPEYKSGAPDWETILKDKSTPSKTTTPSGSRSSSFTYGERIGYCNGWDIYVKPYQETFVYNVVKRKSTPPNKTSWDTIRGEIYTETGFKWNPKGQSFSKWGKIDNIEVPISKICSILEKYYKAGKDEEENEPDNIPQTPTKTSELGLQIGDLIYKTQTGELFLLTSITDKNYEFVIANNEPKILPRNIFEYDFQNGTYKKYEFEQLDEFIKDNQKIKVALRILDLYETEVGIIEFYLDPQVQKFLGKISKENLKNYLITNRYVLKKKMSDESSEPATQPQKKTKEEIQRAILGLQVLAEAGNENAKKAIIGLEILLENA